jgi:hypothetical protein
VELLRRCWQPVTLMVSDHFEIAPWLNQARAWGWNELCTFPLQASGLKSFFLWAEPESDSAFRIACQLRSKATLDVQLAVVASSGLRRYLPVYQSTRPPAALSVSVTSFPGLLRKAGWQVEDCIGFHGPRSVTWIYLMQVASWVGRPDWADRLWFSVRKTYREENWLWRLAPLALILAGAI